MNRSTTMTMRLFVHICVVVTLTILGPGLGGSGVLAADRVQCAENYFCDSQFPICCGATEGYRHYCYRGGSFCCDHTKGYAMLGCPVGTTCCIGPKDGWRQCCSAGTTCIEGRCIGDPCQAHTDEATCHANNTTCGWCCGSGQCMSLSMASVCTGSTMTTPTSNTTCPDRCTQHHSCGDCTKSGCEWCCSQGKCTAPGNSPCSKFSRTTDTNSCAKCDVDGTGLVHVDDSVATDFWVFMFIIIAIVVLVAFACAICARLAHYRYQTQLRAAIAQRALEIDRREPFDASPARSKLYGFSSTPEALVEPPPLEGEDGLTRASIQTEPSADADANLPTSPSDEHFPTAPISASPQRIDRSTLEIDIPAEWDEEHVMCVVCMEKSAVVYAHPCQHCMMCVSCAFKQQLSHIQQLEAKYNRTGRLQDVTPTPCALCRTPMEALVYLPAYIGPGPATPACTQPSTPAVMSRRVTFVDEMIEVSNNNNVVDLDASPAPRPQRLDDDDDEEMDSPPTLQRRDHTASPERIRRASQELHSGAHLSPLRDASVPGDVVPLTPPRRDE
eukprot:PhM_4_TR5587/c0_g1_i1/m.29622